MAGQAGGARKQTPAAAGDAWEGATRLANHAAAALFVSAASLLMSGPASADDPRVEPAVMVTEVYGGADLTAPTSVAFDGRRGEMLVANTGRQRIDVLSLDGRPLARFPHSVRQPDGMEVEGQPRSLAVCPDGRVLVVDYQAAYVDVVDFRGRSVGQLDLPAADATLVNGPGALAVDAAGTILVGTRGDEGRVHRFSAGGKYLGSWGQPGSEPGRLSRISCLAWMPDGKVAVGCVGTELVMQIFDAEGRYLMGFGRHDIGPGNFSFPSGAAVTPDGRIWVTDELRQTVQVFDASGGYLGKVGQGGQAAGEFLYPSSIASLGDSLLAVTERVGNRLQVLRIR